jgi:polyphosphate kinase 2 (PPK2 family)
MHDPRSLLVSLVKRPSTETEDERTLSTLRQNKSELQQNGMRVASYWLSVVG